MKTKCTLLLFFILIFLLPGKIKAQDAKEIISKADEKWRGNSSKGEMSMTIARPKWSRTVVMKSWSKGDKYFLIYIKSPAKEKGQTFLKIDRKMWHWIPNIERTINIPPSMMMTSWMGSDFTNDDLMQQSSIIKDYTHKLLATESIRGKNCYKVQLTPKPNAPVVWGKIVTWITVDGYDQWKALYFDEDEELVHTENAYNIKRMGDRSIPTKIEIIPEDKPGQKTILEIIDMDFNIPIDESFFSIQNMKKVR